MSGKKLVDERLVQARNQILSEVAMLIYLFAVGAFFVKVVFLEKGIGDCVVEYVILLIAPLYQYIRARQLKVSLYAPGSHDTAARRRRNIISLVTGALLFALCFWKMGADAKEVLPGLVVFVIAYQAVRKLVENIEKKRNRRLEQEYEDRE